MWTASRTCARATQTSPKCTRSAHARPLEHGAQKSYSPAEERRRLTRRHLSHRPPPPATGASTPGAPSAARAQQGASLTHTQHTALRSANSLAPRPAPLLTPRSSSSSSSSSRAPRFPAADPAKIGTLDGLGISARPRPKCRSEARATRLGHTARPPHADRRLLLVVVPHCSLRPLSRLASPPPLSPLSTYRARTCRSLRTSRRAARSSATTASTRERLARAPRN